MRGQPRGLRHPGAASDYGTHDEAGESTPSGGVLAAFDPPSGAGLRTDTFGYAGYATSPRYDSLLAKVVASSRAPFEAVAAKLSRALREFRIDGVDTNIAFLRAILDHPDFRAGKLGTDFAAERVLDSIHGRCMSPVRPGMRRALGAARQRRPPGSATARIAPAREGPRIGP